VLKPDSPLSFLFLFVFLVVFALLPHNKTVIICNVNKGLMSKKHGCHPA
jgi:uncharacterized membrane protein